MNTRSDTPEYRLWYERGWRYSRRDTATLDHLDSIGAPDAMYDGYFDWGAGRQKWHLLRCHGCPDHPDSLAPGFVFH